MLQKPFSYRHIQLLIGKTDITRRHVCLTEGLMVRFLFCRYHHVVKKWLTLIKCVHFSKGPLRNDRDWSPAIISALTFRAGKAISFVAFAANAFSVDASSVRITFSTHVHFEGKKKEEKELRTRITQCGRAANGEMHPSKRRNDSRLAKQCHLWKTDKYDAVHHLRITARSSGVN